MGRFLSVTAEKTSRHLWRGNGDQGSGESRSTHEPCSHSGIVRDWLRSGIAARRYRLPWLRFVSGFRFVRGVPRGVTDYRGFVSSAAFGSFGETHEALQIAVASFRRVAEALREWRQLARHGFGKPVAHGISPVDRFFCQGLPECRGFVSRGALGNGFVSSRRYRLPLGSFCSGA